MIPRIIHYCWFGKEKKPEKVKKCIQSWKKYCPDYNLKEWNETNFDINMNQYTKDMYDQKKFAFLSDYVRLLVVYQEGGIYMDTDVELIKPLDELLKLKAYIGFENDKYINTGLGYGAEKGNKAVKQMIDEYSRIIEIWNENSKEQGCPVLNTLALEKMGIKRNGQYQSLEDISVYPSCYFNPYDSLTGELNTRNETYSIHWYAGSWMSQYERYRNMIGKRIRKLTKIIKGAKK